MGVLDKLKTDDIVQIRRKIHQYPELKFHEVETAKLISQHLAEAGIPHETGIAQTGIVGEITATRPTARTLLLRADMDALPVLERTDLPFASTRGGIMHACGHDAHVAMLIGAARELNAARDELNCNVRLLFQPAEEGGNGAKEACDSGKVLSGGVIGALALHVYPNMQVGEIGLCKGQTMAAVDMFELKLMGTGGHGAEPTENSSITYVAAQIVDNLYSLVARKFHPAEKVLLSICNIEAGTTFNVMPKNAVIRGTFRSYSERARAVLPVYMEQIVGCIAAAYDIEYSLKVFDGHPPVINNDEMVGKAAEIADSVGKVVWQEYPSMMSDDFSYISTRVPSCYAFLGCGQGASLHNDTFDIDEACLAVGVQFLTEFAKNF